MQIGKKIENVREHCCDLIIQEMEKIQIYSKILLHVMVGIS
jgi:hypothetical protein